jgi:DNA-binding transcriptional regulator YbjK
MEEGMAAARQGSRASRVARAAVTVLGRKGAEALNHRAVDRQARLPLGSTSNLFRTRAALMGAVCDYLTERDLDQLSDAAARLAASPDVTPDRAASALVDVVQQWSEVDAIDTCARLELFLAARRDAKIAAGLARARAAFRDFSSRWLDSVAPGRGVHLRALMALIEGLAMAQLLHPEGRMSRAELETELRAFLRAIIE